MSADPLSTQSLAQILEPKADAQIEEKKPGDDIDLAVHAELFDSQINAPSNDGFIINGKPGLLKDCASVGQAHFGNFTGAVSQQFFRGEQKVRVQQLALLRSNDTIEVYQIYLKQGVEPSPDLECRPENESAEKYLSKISDQLVLLSKYQLPTLDKISKIIVVRKPGTGKDMIVAAIPQLKFMTLELEPDLMEFRIVCMHNLKNDYRLQMTGKAMPRQGFLQPFFLSPQAISEDIVQKAQYEGRGRPRKEPRPLAFEDEKLLKFLGQEQRQEFQNYDISGFVYLADDTKLVVVQFKPFDLENITVLNSSIAKQAATSSLTQLFSSDSDQGSGDFEKLKEAISEEYLDVYVPNKSTLDSDPIHATVKSDDLEYKRGFIFPTDIVFPTQVFDLETMKPLESYAVAEKKDTPYDFTLNRSTLPSEQRLISIQDLKVIYPHPSTAEKYGGPCDNPELPLEVSKRKTEGNQFNMSSSEGPDLDIINIFVLHEVLPDRTTGSKAKPQSLEVNIYRLNLIRAIRQFYRPSTQQDKLASHTYQSPATLHKEKEQRLFNYKVVRPSSVLLVQKIEKLNFYTTSILSQPSFGRQVKNDLVYFVSNVSIYAFRQERQTLIEVQTSPIAKALSKITTRIHTAAEDPNQQTSSNPKPEKTQLAISGSDVSMNIHDQTSLELKFDGSTRFLALPNNRLLIVMENQQRFIVHFKFNQPDIEVDAVYFTKATVGGDASRSSKRAADSMPMIPSVVTASFYDLPSEVQAKSRQNTERYLLFVGSYFCDQQLLQLSPSFNPTEVVAGSENEKRPRVLSQDNILVPPDGSKQESKQAQQQVQSNIPEVYNMTQLDWLPTICPMTATVPLDKDNFLISSGHPMHSYLTLARGVESGELPVDPKNSMKIPNCQAIFALKFKIDTLTQSQDVPSEDMSSQQDQSQSQPVLQSKLLQFIVVSQATGSKMLEYGGRIAEIKFDGKSQGSFILDEPTIFAENLPVRPSNFIQVTPTRLVHLSFDGLTKQFAKDNILSLEPGSQFTQCKLLLGGQFIAAVVKSSWDASQLRIYHTESLTEVKTDCSELVVRALKQPLAIHPFSYTSPERAEKQRHYIAAIDGFNKAKQALVIIEHDSKFKKSKVIWRSAPEDSKMAYSLLSLQSSIIKNLEAKGEVNTATKLLASCSADLTLPSNKLLSSGDIQALLKGQSLVKPTVPGIVDFIVMTPSSEGTQTPSPNKLTFYFVTMDGRTKIYEMNLAPTLGVTSQAVLKSVESPAFKLVNRVPEASWRDQPVIHTPCLFEEVNQVIVFYKNLEWLKAPLAVETAVFTERKGRVLANSFPRAEFSGMRSMIKIKLATSSRSSTVSRFFFCLREKAGLSFLTMGNFSNQAGFELQSPSQNLASAGLHLWRGSFPRRAISALCLHKKKFIAVAHFHRAHRQKPGSKSDQMIDFLPTNNTLGHHLMYGLDVVALPRKLSGEKSTFAELAKDLVQLMKDLPLSMKQEFAADEVITELKSFEFTIKNHGIYTKGEDKTEIQVDPIEELIVVATQQLESKVEKDSYPATITLLGVDASKPALKLEPMDKFQHKGNLYGLLPFRGMLFFVNHDRLIPKIHIQTICFNQHWLTDETLQPGQGRFIFDPNAEKNSNPNCVKNVVTCASAEGDFILLGDMFKHFQVFRPLDEDEKKKENIRVQDYIILKRHYHSLMDVNTFALHSFQRMQYFNNSKQPFKDGLSQVLSVSKDGALRCYLARHKNMECSGQLHLKDHVLEVIKFQKSKGRYYDFVVVPKHGGLIFVQSASRQKQELIEKLCHEFGRLMSFKGAVSPIEAIQGSHFDIGNRPQFLTGCEKNMRAMMMIQQRFEDQEAEKNKAQDARVAIETFAEANLAVKMWVATRLGFKSPDELELELQ